MVNSERSYRAGGPQLSRSPKPEGKLKFPKEGIQQGDYSFLPPVSQLLLICWTDVQVPQLCLSVPAGKAPVHCNC